MRIYLLLIFMSYNVSAFKMDPYSTYIQNSDSYEKKFIEPVHENLTIKSLNLAKKEYSSISINREDLVFGVRWNDDPLQFFKSHPTDFFVYYKDSCTREDNIDASWDLLYRTHCGDMQFLHSMASMKNETAEETKAKIMMWAEFTYKVSTGEIPHNYRFENISNKLSPESKVLFDKLITNNKSIRIEWQPEDLFSLECDRDFSILNWFHSFISDVRPTELSCSDFNNDHTPSAIQDRSLGSLLHLLQDSFSDSHVQREPLHIEKISLLTNRGRIENFLIYTEQNEKAHSMADLNYRNDTSATLKGNNDLVSISKQVIILSNKERITSEKNWPKVKGILNNAFELVDVQALPSGGKYESRDYH